MYTCELNTPLGIMTASAENDALTGLWFRGQKYYPANSGAWINKPDYPVFIKLKLWLDEYFQGRFSKPSFALKAQGTDFQMKVWSILERIPYGKTMTYGDIARELASIMGVRSMSAQAVGGAVGHNPISILIPCHRVIGSDRRLTGYAGGIDKKSALLKLEHTDVIIDL